MRISDWSSDVCSSDLYRNDLPAAAFVSGGGRHLLDAQYLPGACAGPPGKILRTQHAQRLMGLWTNSPAADVCLPMDWSETVLNVEFGFGPVADSQAGRSEEHTSELQSLMRISYAVFCLKKNTIAHTKTIMTHLTHILRTLLRHT